VPIQTTWREPTPIDVPLELVELVGHRLGAELLVRRGFANRDAALAFVDPWNRGPTGGSELPGLDAAVGRLRRAVERREKVLVWGDFDVDGQTSTAVFVLALRRLGLDPAWHVPHRATDSHGLNDGCLEHAARVGASLVVTCDCGIGDDAQLRALAQGGVDVVVTDHHALPPRLHGVPYPAHALVWPGGLPEEHPIRPLTGVGVAYMTAAELLRSFGEGGDDLLDLVALGTIADVARLVGENRYLVQRGLPALNAGRRPGIKALLTLAGRLGAPPMDAGVAGWIIAPPLNAFGRLGKAQPAVELLMADDEAAVQPIAEDAHALNQQRQGYCERIVEQATELVEACLDGRGEPRANGPYVVSDSAIVAADPAWHLGVVGLAAGRLAQSYLRPVALATRAGDGEGRVSVRSAAWCDLNDVIAELAADPAIGFRGGSHSMAAGGSLPWEHVGAFAEAFDRAVSRQRPPGALVREVTLDAVIGLGDVTLPAVRSVARLAPFGNGNPAPCFLLRDVRIAEAPRQMGGSQRHLRIALADDEGHRAWAVWWDGAPRSLPAGRLDLALCLEENEYEGRPEPRLVVQHLRPMVRPTIAIR